MTQPKRFDLVIFKTKGVVPKIKLLVLPLLISNFHRFEPSTFPARICVLLQLWPGSGLCYTQLIE